MINFFLNLINKICNLFRREPKFIENPYQVSLPTRKIIINVIYVLAMLSLAASSFYILFFINMGVGDAFINWRDAELANPTSSYKKVIVKKAS